MSQLPLFSTPLWSVGSLSRYLRDIFESDAALQDLWVQGEVSNLSRPASGHIYFTLKDSTSALKCVMWRSQAVRQPFLPKDGQHIEVHGALNIYEASGQYQLYADLFRPVGEGALYAEFLRLKARLEGEGLFAPERKRPLPRWPQRIGIVTSSTGAALRDMINTLRRRYPMAEVTLSPTAVQGDEAPAGIVRALEQLNRVVRPDVILLARGGGSIEDLWAFNDEGVARAIAASTAPVISGVGHETDFTIADFVADMRAPTPTAAAEQCAPNCADLKVALGEMQRRLERSASSALQARRWQHERLANRLLARSPHTQVRTDRQRLDDLSRRTAQCLGHTIAMQRARLNGLQGRLTALNPQAILERGYAILTRPDGEVVHSVGQIHPADALLARVSDGQFAVTVPVPPEAANG
jgi:exodeoxyribonuclease VII large subunit